MAGTSSPRANSPSSASCRRRGLPLGDGCSCPSRRSSCRTATRSGGEQLDDLVMKVGVRPCVACGNDGVRKRVQYRGARIRQPVRCFWPTLRPHRSANHPEAVGLRDLRVPGDQQLSPTQDPSIASWVELVIGWYRFTRSGCGSRPPPLPDRRASPRMTGACLRWTIAWVRTRRRGVPLRCGS